MDKQTAKRLTELEEQLRLLTLRADMASQREQALIEALAFLLARCPNQEGASYLIDRLEQQENQPDRAESIDVFEGLIELVGLLNGVSPKP